MLKPILSGILMLSLVACKFESKPSEEDEGSEANAIEDGSWFKNGTDRFYLAYTQADGLILGGPEYRGWDVLMGVGCYGEAKDRNTLIDLPNGRGKKKLTNRELISDFKLAANPKKPKRGECVVLLGNQYERADFKIDVNPELWKTALTTYGSTTAACIGLGMSIFSIASTWTGAAAAAPATLGTSVAGAAAVTPAMWVTLSTSTLFCSTGAVNSFRVTGDYQKNENKRVLFETLAKAEEIAMTELAAKKFDENMTYLDRLKTLQEESYGNPNKLIKAAAILNPYLVRAFNAKVHERMEQGWFGGTKFFDAAKSVTTEYQNAIQKYRK